MFFLLFSGLVSEGVVVVGGGGGGEGGLSGVLSGGGYIVLGTIVMCTKAGYFVFSEVG